MNTFGDQLGRALVVSPRFHRDVDRWRMDAAQARRSTSKRQFSEFESVQAMCAEVDAAYRTPWNVKRPFSHDGVVGEWPLADLEAHARQLQRGAYHYLGATASADELRRFVDDEALGIPIAACLATLPALTGAGASSAFDRFVDRPTRHRRAMDLAWRRAVGSFPTPDVSERFFYFKTVTPADDGE